MTLHRFDPGARRKDAEMPSAEGAESVVPYRLGLSTRTALRQPAMDIAAVAIALGRNRHTEWSGSDDTLDRVLRYLKRDNGYHW